MANEWRGKSRGSVLGYKIFVFCIKNFGVRSAYFLLYFVALYFCFFSGKNTRAIFYYLHKRRHYSWFKSVINVYKSYYVFGQTIIDKVAIPSGLRNKFNYQFDGIEQIEAALQQKKGGILISAHVGNFEIAEFFLNEVDEKAGISLLTTDEEHREIKEYLERFTKKTNTRFIIIKNDLSHIFEINAALARNEIICITGDRYIKEAKHMTADLMGQEARFPAGPFLIGSRLQIPVLFVYVMKHSATKYNLYARTVVVKNRDAQDLLDKYVHSLEWILEKYPLQWFNYFDFWNDLKSHDKE